jgi:hypothetical protein
MNFSLKRLFIDIQKEPVKKTWQEPAIHFLIISSGSVVTSPEAEGGGIST